ncbi:MAG: hypothetical protein KatS3mg009_1126 [Acidimicrobiia bacterium]|nr:MAG: hypothetical protein KatS3mg009_1126 [Acidimicrobiia bacterium]
MTHRCLGFRFTLSADDRTVRARLDDLFAACRDDGGPPGARLHVGAAGARGQVVVTDGGQVLFGPGDVETALAYVVWEVNRRAVGGAEGYLLVHGAAAARGGGAVVVVAASGGGKSTFVHALTRAGWGYLTDEAVAVDLSSGLVVPYPKPIALAGEGGRERLVAPGELVAGVAPPSPPRLVLVPERREGVPVSFEPVGRAAALVHLAEHSFNFRRAGCAAFDAAAAVVRGSECLRVRYAEADDAVAALGRDPSVWGGPA